MKRSILLVSLVGLVACAVPAAADAAPMVKNPKGKAVGFMTGVSANTIITLEAGEAIECTTFDLQITFAKNEEGLAEGAGVGVATGKPALGTHIGECETKKVGIPINVTKITVNQFAFMNFGVGNGSLELTYDVTFPTGAVMCTLVGEFGVVYFEGGAVFAIAGNLKGTENLGACSANAAISGGFVGTEAEGNFVTIG